MKLFGHGAAGVMVAGHSVSYGLIAVIMAIPVSALAIRQFTQGGGLQLGQQSPDLAGLGADVGGGGGGPDLGTFSDLLPPAAKNNIPVFDNLSPPAPVFGPIYSMDYGAPAAAPSVGTTISDVFIAPQSPSFGGIDTGFTAGSVSYTAPAPAPAPAPSSGGSDVGFTQGGYVAPAPAPAPAPTSSGTSTAGSGGGFTF